MPRLFLIVILWDNGVPKYTYTRVNTKHWVNLFEKDIFSINDVYIKYRGGSKGSVPQGEGRGEEEMTVILTKIKSGNRSSIS